MDLIESSEKEWNENFRYFVSGYYEGIAIRYLGPVLCIFLVLCTIGSYISGSENWRYSLFFMACAIAMKNTNLSDVDRALLQEGLNKANSYINKIEELFDPYGGIN